MRLLAAVVATVLLGSLAGCGGGGDGADSAKATASPSAAAGAPLDDDALLLMHDELVTCAQQNDSLGLITHLSGDRAVSDSEGSGGGEYDDALAAPKATVGLVKTGAQFVGLRADTRHRRGTSDVDVLIFRSEDEAQKGAEALEQEAGGKTVQSGLFVNVSLREDKGADAASLERCESDARP